MPLVHHEGLNLQLSRLINRGYLPYTQIFTLDYPLFVTFIGRLGQFQLSPLGFRLIFLGFSLLLLANVTAIARFWFGDKVALAAALLLATATTFLAEAAQVAPVLPALSIALLSPVLICYYLSGKPRFWLWLAGLSWGSSLFMAQVPWSIGLASLLFLLLAPVHSAQPINLGGRWSAVLQETSFWVAGALVALLIGLLLATPNLIFNQLLTDYAQIRAALPVPQQANFRLIGQFLAFNLWLFLFAAYSLVELGQKPSHPLWLIVLWGLSSFAWLMLQTVLASTEVALLLPPLAIMAGWGVVQVGEYGARRVNFQTGQRWVWGGASLLLLLYLLVGLQQFRAFQLREIDTASDLAQVERRQEIASFIAQHTDPDACVIIDDAALAVVANRLPAPELTELSEPRMLSGLLTEDQLIDLVREKECQAVVFSKRENYLHLAGFQGLLSSYYPHEDKIIQTRIYYR